MSLVTVSEKRNRRTFDYDEASARRAAGEPVKDIAASLGVSPFAVYRATDAEFRARNDALVLEALRSKREPCLGGCGRHSYGCRCSECRRASAEAKAARRARSSKQCVHGCGRLVPTINRDRPDKPLECAQCARKRVAAERRAG